MRRLALLVATYRYQDSGLRQLTAPGHDAEALAEVLRHPDIAGFDVTVLINEPHHVVGRAVGEFYRNRRRDDLTLLYFTGHGVKDDEGRLYLAMTDTRRDDLLFTALSAQQIDYAMDSCSSRQKILVLDCCYSGAFPPGRVSKADVEVHALEKFRGKGRVVLTASDATQYSFEGDHITGQGTRSVFTRYLVEGLTTGEADLDGNGDITLDELYSYVHDRVIDEMPQQRPKKIEDVEGRIVIARNIHWRLPGYMCNALESPFARDRLGVLDGLAHLHRVGNGVVQAEVINQIRRLINDDSRAVSTAAMALMTTLNPDQTQPETAQPRWVPTIPATPRHNSSEQQDEGQVITSPTPPPPTDDVTTASGRRDTPTNMRHALRTDTAAEKQIFQWANAGQSSLALAARWGLNRLSRPQIRVTAATAALIVLLLIAVLYTVNITSETTTPGTIPIATIPVGTNPADVAVTPDGRHAYVTNFTSSNVSVIDTANNTVTTTIPTGTKPNGVAVAPDGRHAYVTNSGSSNVSVIDTASNTVTTTIPAGGFPRGVAVAPDGRHAYITNGNSNNVSVIDTANNTVTTTIPVGAEPLGVAVAPDGRHAYITNNASNNVSVIDTAKNTVTTTIPVVGMEPLGVAVTPNGRHAYITNSGSSKVSVIDTANNTVTTTIFTTTTISTGTKPNGVAVAPDGRHAYITNNASNNVSVIDTANNTVTTTIPTGTKPNGVAVAPDGRHAYITNNASNNVSVIEIGSG